MEKTGLKRLSTFGVMARSGFTRRDVVELIDAMTIAGLIATEDVDRFRPVVKLSDIGWAWIRDPEAEVPPLSLEGYLVDKVRNGGLERMYPDGNPHTARLREAPISSAAPPPLEPSQEGLHDSLRRLRLDLAREAGLSPAYIFSNQTLDELVRHRPRTPQALAQVKGIGPAKLERFGSALLAAMAGEPSVATAEAMPSHSETHSSPSLSRPTEKNEPRPEARVLVTRPSPPTSSYVSTEEWTWRLLDRGFTIDEAAAIRGLEVSAIVRHATWSARKGMAVPFVAFLSEETASRWTAHLQKNGTAASPPDDPSSERYWELFVACQKASEARYSDPASYVDKARSVDADD
jgi:ATP-dependent DNA helicase RecQ